MSRAEWETSTLWKPRNLLRVDDVGLERSFPYPGLDEDDAFARKAERQEHRQAAYYESLDPATLAPAPIDGAGGPLAGVPKNQRRAALMDLFSDLRDEPLNYEEISRVAEFLRGLAAENAPSEPPLGLAEEHHLNEWPRGPGRRAIASGTNGVVLGGTFLKTYAPLIFPADAPPAFLIKTSLLENSNSETVNELLVGLLATNALRSVIPSFMFVYGGFLCAPAVVEDDVVHLCSAPSARSGRFLYEMIETIAEAQTLFDWIQEQGEEPSFERDLWSIILQILLALVVADERLEGGFSHNDLHNGNILIRPTQEVDLTFPLADGKTATVRTRWIATIIDFGRACTIVPAPGGPLWTGKNVPRLGLMIGRHNHLHDVVYFISTTLAAVWGIHPTLFQVMGRILLRPFFREDEAFIEFMPELDAFPSEEEFPEEESLEDSMHFETWEDKLHSIVPFDIDVSPREVVHRLTGGDSEMEGVLQWAVAGKR